LTSSNSGLETPSLIGDLLLQDGFKSLFSDLKYKLDSIRTTVNSNATFRQIEM
ncbi:hypothetical protein DSO57_1012656, partial [Entomophthora muscae]